MKKLLWVSVLISIGILAGSCGSGAPLPVGADADPSPRPGVPTGPGPTDRPNPGPKVSNEIFPRSPTPADRIHAVSLARISHLLEPNREIIAFMTLAGLVNRAEPRIYLASSTADPWPHWMKQRGDILDFNWVWNPYELFTVYGAETNGIVVIDPAIAASYNVACVVAACEGLIACHPDHVSEILEHNPSLGVVRDLRDERFAHNGEAYHWAYDTYWREMRHDMLAWIDTSFRPNGPRDYCVAHKVFPLWVNGLALPWEPGMDIPAERAFAAKVLGETPTGIPILGWPGSSRGLGEYGGIQLWSEYGKYAVVPGDATGLSFHSGCAPLSMPRSPSPAPLDFDIDKTYYATYHSEGELLWHGAPFRGPWETPSRGQIPYGWSIGPLHHELIPAPLDWYLHGDDESAQPLLPSDELMSAMSGLGYIFPQDYPDEARTYFLDRTRDYLETHRITSLAIHFKEAPYSEKKAIAREYGERLGASFNSIFVDYGYKPRTHYRQSNYLSNGIPTFHVLSPLLEEKGPGHEEIAEEFRQRLHDRGSPAFGQIFLRGWGSSPLKAIEMRDALNGHGRDTYVPVRPDQLGTLYKASGAGIELDFMDDFSAGDGRWTVASGTWSAQGMRYTQEDTDPAWHVSRAGNCQWDNIAVSAVMRGSDGGTQAGMALFGRFRGLDNAYYRFEWWQDTGGSFARLFRKARGRPPALIAVTSYESELDEDTALEMVVHCDTIVCSIDGSEVIRTVDTDPIRRGWVALGSYGGKTVFDDVRVERSRTCVDCDGDGYGDPGDAWCRSGEDWDCDDHDPGEVPRGVEGPLGDPTCTDGLDNDCDGLFDSDDADCR
jgi:hypothetical protein